MNVKNLFREVQYPIELYDKDVKQIYYENSIGYWWKKEYNDKGLVIYCEDSNGFWYKREYNDKGLEVYYENSIGDTEDNRPIPTKELTVQEIEEMLGYSVRIVK